MQEDSDTRAVALRRDLNQVAGLVSIACELRERMTRSSKIVVVGLCGLIRSRSIAACTADKDCLDKSEVVGVFR